MLFAGHSPKKSPPKIPPTTPTIPEVPESPKQVNPLKRKKTALLIDGDDNNETGISLHDIMREIKSSEAAREKEANAIRNDIATLRSDVTSQINNIQNSVELVTKKVEDLSNKVTEVDARVDVVAKIASENRKMVSSYKQDKLEKFMEIDGVKNEIFNTSIDCKNLAIDIMKSFNISVHSDEIEHAFKKEIKLKKQIDGSDKKNILMVIFKSLNSKIRVMKAKRDLKTESSIYFNQALTASNRNLIFKAKNIVGKKLKVYFARGCVRVQKKDKSEITVDDETKLYDVQEYFDQIKNQQ